MNKNVRNVLIVLAIAALVVLIPGGGTGANVAIQAISLLFLGALAWIASRLYREHRVALGDRRRATLYIAVAVVALALTARQRLWVSPSGKIVWFALLAGAVYAVFAVIWSSRKYG